ncbi:MAG: tetratricopeptide repeat protein, partial [Dehalococcoidia bacterium]
ALGDLPLALEQAGAYIDEAATSLADYLTLFQERRADLWGEEHSPEDYSETIATTWEVSLQKLSPEALGLMNLCAFLAPEDISLELLTGGVEHLPENLASAVSDSLVMRRVIRDLRRYSLIEGTTTEWSVHRLVQAVVRDRLSEDERKKWVGVAVILLREVFQGDLLTDVEAWPACARMLSHALASVGHAEAVLVTGGDTSYLLDRVATYLQVRAEFDQARLAFERALGISEAAFGPEHPTVATHLNNLARVLQDQGDLAGGKERFERALGIIEAVYGPEHPNVAIHLNNLASVLRAQGDLAGAKERFERALGIDEAAYGPEHPNVAIRLNNLASVLRAQGDLAGAKERFERALGIDEAAYGPEHPNVAIRLNNLANVLQDQGDLAGAKEKFERSYEMFKQFLGEDHPSTATARRNLESLSSG